MRHRIWLLAIATAIAAPVETAAEGGWVRHAYVSWMHGGKTVLACVVVMLVDRLLLNGLGPARLLIDALIYVGLVLTMGAVSVSESLALVKTMRANRRATD